MRAGEDRVVNGGALTIRNGVFQSVEEKVQQWQIWMMMLKSLPICLLLFVMLQSHVHYCMQTVPVVYQCAAD